MKPAVAVSGRVSQPAPLGVGMDIEECAAWRTSTAPRSIVPRAAGSLRWSTNGGRAKRPREAAFKACPPSRAMHEVTLALEGSPERGRARVLGESPVIEVEWGRWEGLVVSLAVARAQ